MSEQLIDLGRARTDADGCRRYRPIQVAFDTRNLVLGQEIQEGWDAETKEMWERMKAQVRDELAAEHGAANLASKIDNYRAIGPEPWSIVFAHSALLRQVRSSFAHGDFYPALVAACALGERLLHELVLALREDFKNHRATTRRVRKDDLGTDWGALIGVLHGWGIFNDEIASTYYELEEQRHAAVHFNPTLRGAERDSALAALLALQKIIEQVLEPHGGPPRYIADTPGVSYIALEAEKEPLIQRIFIPNSALVSPAHRLEADARVPTGWQVYDDLDYPSDPLTDEEFAQRLQERAGNQ